MWWCLTMYLKHYNLSLKHYNASHFYCAYSFLMLGSVHGKKTFERGSFDKWKAQSDLFNTFLCVVCSINWMHSRHNWCVLNFVRILQHSTKTLILTLSSCHSKNKRELPENVASLLEIKVFIYLHVRTPWRLHHYIALLVWMRCILCRNDHGNWQYRSLSDREHVLWKTESSMSWCLTRNSLIVWMCWTALAAVNPSWSWQRLHMLSRSCCFWTGTTSSCQVNSRYLQLQQFKRSQSLEFKWFQAKTKSE